MDYFFGIRLGVIAILYGILTTSIMRATTTYTLLSQIILFLLPMALDYLSHTPYEKKNKSRQSIGFWVSVLGSAFCAIFLLGQIELPFILKHVWSKSFISVLFIFYVVLAIIDWITYSSHVEVEYRKRIQSNMRRIKLETPQQRVRKYEKIKKKRNMEHVSE